MSSDVILDLVGYAASVLVAVSLMMRSIVRLRWISLTGAAVFTLYGVLIDAYPVVALNFAIVLINAYFLVQMRRTREAFSVIELPPDSQYLQEFLEFHGRDIERFQPGFRFDPGSRQHVLMVLRDLVPAGILIAEPREPGVLKVTLDYVTPAYRDLKVGEYLFRRRLDLFSALGARRLETDPGSREHRAYLARVGFSPMGPRLVLEIPSAP